MLLSLGLVMGTIVSSVIVFRRRHTRPSSSSPSADGRVQFELLFRSGDEPVRRHFFRNAFLSVALMSPFALVALLVVTWMLWTAVAFQTVTPTRQAVVGTWRGRDGNTIVFTPDGRFSGQPTVEAAPASGTWRIGKDMGDDITGVVLSFDDGATFELYARGSRSAPTLFFYIGDMDANRRYEFKKQH